MVPLTPVDVHILLASTVPIRHVRVAIPLGSLKEMIVVLHIFKDITLLSLCLSEFEILEEDAFTVGLIITEEVSV